MPASMGSRRINCDDQHSVVIKHPSWTYPIRCLARCFTPDEFEKKPLPSFVKFLRPAKAVAYMAFLGYQPDKLLVNTTPLKVIRTYLINP